MFQIASTLAIKIAFFNVCARPISISYASFDNEQHLRYNKENLHFRKDMTTSFDHKRFIMVI